MNGAGGRILRGLGCWWLRPMPATRLGGVRIACGLYSLWYLLPRHGMFREIARTDAALFDPVGVTRLLPGPPPPEILDVVYWITVAGSVLFTLGWRHRWTGPIFASALLVLLCCRNSWSMIFHMHNALVIHALVLGVAPAADAWSIDALRRARRGAPRRGPSWRYGWAIMLVSAVTITPYLLSGIAKVAGPEGFLWASGEALRAQVTVNAIRYDVLVDGPAPVLTLIYEHAWVFWCMGVGTLVLELGAPIALVHRRVGAAWALATFMMHWGIYFVMGIKFRYQLSGLMYASFFDTERLEEAATRFRKRFTGRGAEHVLRRSGG